ncbi:MAG: right-handed parallel beta-helix repeat-containing protein [Candidatus Eisenbacteria sp.]|nr:right-handed parallel beta-helix repeat-containing protein [Candidatus Eisenbacteria bacterium]
MGVSAAVASDTLLLASGTFQGPGNRDIDLEGKAIVLRSKAGDPAACVIDCEGTSAQPHRGLLFLSAEPAGCRVEGIAIVNGYAGGVLGSRGGAILMTEDARPIFENCWIIGGTALSGGGIYLDRASPTFRTSLIVGNFAAIAGGGVVCQNNAWPLFEECVFARNLADVGGGLFCEWSLPTIRSCTFVANGAAIAGGIGIFAASTAILENTIIAFGTRAAAVACEDGGAILTCCDLYGNSGGDWTGCIASQENVNGNITLDPLFCDPENGDYHLHADSPCAPGGPVHPGCGLIGAWGAACGPTGTQIDSWGGLKARFRAQVTEGQAARTTTAEGAP